MSSQSSNVEMSLLDSTTPYQFITQKDVMSMINSEVSQLQEVTSLDPDQCLTLLLKFEFDKESILEKYNENEQFLVENGIIPSKIESNDQEECSVCCSDNQLIKLDCGHSACRNCWESYLARKIEDGYCLIECMDSECKLLIGKSFIDEILNDFAHYEPLIIDSFVKVNKTITKCPGATCEFFAKTDSTEPQVVICTCGRVFCFFCGQDPHIPATCRQRQLWNKKCELLAPKIGDESQQWLLEYTKECPKCLVTVQKQGGCTIMLCPNKKCRHCFCWSCREDLATHKLFFCDSAQLIAEKARLDARADLSNFITHYKRFEHFQNLYDSIPPMISTALKSSDPFHRKVTHSYFNARSILINSVIFGFFLRNGKYSLDFKKVQHELEQLTDLLEKSLIDALSNQQGSSELGNNCHDIEKCLKDFLEFCAKGKEYEDLDGQSYRDAWKKAHDSRVNYDYLIQFFTLYVSTLGFSLALRFLIPRFKKMLLSDSSVAYGKTLGIDLRDDFSRYSLFGAVFSASAGLATWYFLYEQPSTTNTTQQQQEVQLATEGYARKFRRNATTNYAQSRSSNTPLPVAGSPTERRPES